MQMGAQGIENMVIIFIIYDYGVEKKKLCKDINIKRHSYSIKSAFEVFRNVEISHKHNSKISNVLIVIGIKRHVFTKCKNLELLGQTVQML